LNRWLLHFIDALTGAPVSGRYLSVLLRII
jgi:hypothetical protein